MDKSLVPLFTIKNFFDQCMYNVNMFKLSRSHDGRLVATGDDFGKVKLYAYPVTQPKVILWHQELFYALFYI